MLQTPLRRYSSRYLLLLPSEFMSIFKFLCIEHAFAERLQRDRSSDSKSWHSHVCPLSQVWHYTQAVTCLELGMQDTHGRFMEIFPSNTWKHKRRKDLKSNPSGQKDLISRRRDKAPTKINPYGSEVHLLKCLPAPYLFIIYYFFKKNPTTRLKHRAVLLSRHESELFPPVISSKIPSFPNANTPRANKLHASGSPLPTYN